MEKEKTLLRIKWGVSRGVNTYGYTICTLYANGEKVARTNGGGYDMAGTVLGAYLKKRYAERIQALTGNHGSMDDGTGYYGLMFYDKETHKGSKTHGPNTYMSLYGACGWNSMVRIANAIGVDVEYLEKDNYLLTEKAI